MGTLGLKVKSAISEDAGSTLRVLLTVLELELLFTVKVTLSVPAAS
jgi:hypothetical protein